jgi:hypothetical protein
MMIKPEMPEQPENRSEYREEDYRKKRDKQVIICGACGGDMTRRSRPKFPPLLGTLALLIGFIMIQFSLVAAVVFILIGMLMGTQTIKVWQCNKCKRTVETE